MDTTEPLTDTDVVVKGQESFWTQEPFAYLATSCPFSGPLYCFQLVRVSFLFCRSSLRWERSRYWIFSTDSNSFIRSSFNSCIFFFIFTKNILAQDERGIILYLFLFFCNNNIIKGLILMALQIYLYILKEAINYKNRHIIYT